MADDDGLPIEYQINLPPEKAQVPIFYQNKELVLLDYTKIFEIHQNGEIPELYQEKDFFNGTPELNVDTTVSLDF